MPEERKLVTILFADVTGSTALGESIDPEDLRALMGRYYAHARRVVATHDGTIEKFIGDDTWLDARLFLLGVESENVVKVFGAINDNSYVAAVTRQTGAAAARLHWRTVAATQRDGLHHIVGAAWHDYANRHLPIVGTIGGIKRQTAIIKAHLSGDLAAQACCQPFCIYTWGTLFADHRGNVGIGWSFNQLCHRSCLSSCFAQSLLAALKATATWTTASRNSVQALDRAEQVQLHLMLLSLCATFPCFRQNAPTCLRQRACQPFGK
jgi:hypothetical protein